MECNLCHKPITKLDDRMLCFIETDKDGQVRPKAYHRYPCFKLHKHVGERVEEVLLVRGAL